MAAYSERTFSATRAVAVTPSDATVFNPVPVALYVGGAGDVAVAMVDGTIVTFTDVAASTLLPLQVSRVLAATTATGIIALYN